MALAIELRGPSDTARVAIDSAATASLVMTNSGAQPLALRAGVPVPEEIIDASGPASLYVSLGDLVEPGTEGSATLGAPGWMSQSFGGQWALTPTAGLTLDAGQPVTFAVTGLHVAGPPRNTSVTVDVYNVDGPGESGGFEPTIAVESASRILPLRFGVHGGNDVFVTRDPRVPIENSLVFYLSNMSPTSPIVPTDAPADGEPEFRLWFVCDGPPGYGAVTTTERAKTIEVAVAEVYKDAWSVEPERDADPPYWRLIPQTHEVLGAGTGATIEFAATMIVSELRPGITYAWLSWTGVHGYDNGSACVELSKSRPKPGILRFHSTTPTVIEEGQLVSLAWQTLEVPKLRLSYTEGPDKRIRSLDAPGDIALSGSCYPPPPDRSTVYHLEAFDADMSLMEVAQPIDVTVHSLPPSIDSFTVSPQVVDPSKQAVDVQLSWSVKHADELRIDSIGIVNDLGCRAKVDGTKDFVLYATGPGAPSASRKVTVFDFTSFLVRHTFTLVSSSTNIGTLTETLTFDKDQGGDYAASCPAARFGRGGHFGWQRSGDTVTITFFFGPLVVRIDGSGLVYQMPFGLVPAGFERAGRRFTAAER